MGEKVLPNRLLTGQEVGGEECRKCRQHPAGGREPVAGRCEDEAGKQYLRRPEHLYGFAAWLAHGGKSEGGA